MVLDFPRSDRIAMRDAMEEQARQTREQEGRIAARMRRAAERRDSLEDLRRNVVQIREAIEDVRRIVARNSIPDEVA